MSKPMSQLSTPAIAPSILTADFGALREEIQEAEQAGVDLIHLDVMDGHFVPNISFGPLVIEAIRGMTSLPLDVHLMISHPERWIIEFASAGASNITVHVEATAHAHRLIQLIKSLDISAGVALNPGTPAMAVRELIPIVDLVLVMSVNPGFGGQSFIPRSIEKIAEVRRMLDELGADETLIEVDGGISAETIGPVAKAGAQVMVAGSSVFNDEQSVDMSVSMLRNALLGADF